ncbi:hypothetical protein BI312_08720 [Xanthomonas citri pv. citri]|nr:hypothetical protein BI314_06145 [Xanthomonas citri pv. citri]APR14939.1 hypothetical protein BI315_08750 [Xanthomonas citri pv. citri]APR21488.1 hypothetical protein BI316_20135 [Xanthomonas citri pv. citri]APR26284.1 hypothetical protein BJD09_21135 [Xanthomonas citri pv. citri]AUZ52403.1 hypothetical protein CLM98_19140 [Xanthomonas citri pv. citri]
MKNFCGDSELDHFLLFFCTNPCRPSTRVPEVLVASPMACARPAHCSYPLWRQSAMPAGNQRLHP